MCVGGRTSVWVVVHVCGWSKFNDFMIYESLQEPVQMVRSNLKSGMGHNFHFWEKSMGYINYNPWYFVKNSKINF